MFDLRWIRDNPETFDAGLRRRGIEPAAPRLLKLDEGRRAAQTELQAAQQRRNEASKQIGQVKREGGDAAALMSEVAMLKGRITTLEETERGLTGEIETILTGLPNLPADDVPDGIDESANVELRRSGETPRFDFQPREHGALGADLGMMDFTRASRLAGARFVILSGALARMERALGQFMLDLQTGMHGYEEISPPLLVRDEALFGTGQLPKFGDDLFRT